jgi:hypothetical protein
MRARNIKPGFFKNEVLAECDPLARILFSGLWCMADRDGRLEYRPKRIKAEVLPYDSCNIEKLLAQLSSKNFIRAYTVNSEDYMEIINFRKHQNCHIKEAESTIPAPCKTGASMVQEQDESGSRPADSLLLIPDSPILNPERGKGASTSPPSSPKNKFLDSVYLTEVEHQKLQEVLGQKSLDIGIEQLDYSITVKGGKYKDHYKTLLNWFKRGYLVEGGNRNGSGHRGSPGASFSETRGAQSDDKPYPPDREY